MQLIDGIDEYGNPNDFNSNFSIKYNDLLFSHFLFISSDKKIGCNKKIWNYKMWTAGFISTIYDNNNPIIWTNKDWLYL